MRVRTLLTSAAIVSVSLLGGGVAWASTTTTQPGGSVPAVVTAPGQINAPGGGNQVADGLASADPAGGAQVQQDLQQGVQQQVGPDIQSGGPDTAATGVAAAGSPA